jgi:hypothetical protein
MILKKKIKIKKNCLVQKINLIIKLLRYASQEVIINFWINYFKGPCAGKTSGLSYLAEKLQYDGFTVLVVPEVATLIAAGGGMIDMANYTVD